MYRKEKRVPTLIALGFLFLGIGGAVYLDKTLHIFTSSAKEDTAIQEVRFANITDNSFTVSWLTSSPATGTIKVSNGPVSITYIDDLDSDNVPRPRFTHFVTVKNLKESTTYTVKIYGNDLRCRNNLSCPSFAQKTGPKLAKVTSISPAHGNIISEAKKEAVGTLVYLTVGKSALLASRSDSSGLWAIPLTNLRSENLSERPEISDNDIVQITVFASPSQTATAVIDIRSIRQNLSVPTIQIGNNYNFISTSFKKDLAQSQNLQVLGSQTQVINTSNKTYDVLFPFQDGDYTPDPQPEIRGVGVAGSKILITVNSTPQTGSVTVDQNGTWRWRPPLPLEPGTHNLSIQAYDQSGNLITVTRQFIVLKSGEQVLGEATASATLTPTMQPTFTPAPTRTSSPTLTNIPPTSTPPLATPPPSGSVQSTIILIGGALFLIISGIKFLVSI